MAAAAVEVGAVNAAMPSGSPVLPPDWPQRLRAALAPEPLPASLARLTGLLPEGTVTPAAVLVAIAEGASGPSLLLTTRAGHLRQHAGQISFPGGRIEASDGGPLAAALRETREEIGIDPAYVEPMGYLRGQLVLTGFSITPVVARLKPGFRLQVDATEVAEVFELPLAVVADAASFRPMPRVVRGVELLLHELPWEGRIIWGATASMLLSLHEVLAASLHEGDAR
jgi:8-oxo-dGTP pyrophosphatase MutT (NUDIX family)